MSKKSRHPVGHLYQFPDQVKEWMLLEVHGHMVHEHTVYCGETRGSFTHNGGHLPAQCRFCHQQIQRGTKDERPGGFILWHTTNT